MRSTILTPRTALNKAFLKVKPLRSEIELFKTNLVNLLNRINDNESEEFQKNLIIDFLKDTYYRQSHFINTKGRNDLVIHNGADAKTNVGVIIETKKYSNKTEMVSQKNMNTKAFQELVLYFLRERVTLKNIDIKNLIITNVYEWFIFDVSVFERLVTRNKAIIKEFENFESGKLAGRTTDFFYSEIAKPFINNLLTEIEFTYFDIRNYKKIIENSNPKDDNQLIPLFKIFSPEHLLKLPFTNDSNSLDKNFYSELLHIIGLTEAKADGKRIIERNKEHLRNKGSLLENTITQLESHDKVTRIAKPHQYGDTHAERLFNITLALNITWINRILFLKLLEAQLITYHKGDKSYSFLNIKKIRSFDDLNSLFFQVLAREHNNRDADIASLFLKVPYLNSSLFDPTDIEHETLFISNLKDDKTIPILSSTVLKDSQGKKRSGELNCLEYLFEFLNSYDFSSEGAEEIQEENKTLINASVLGLIFEKINGYKDGSFFTPGMITMYMCSEVLRLAVLQKFNKVKNWKCKDLNELFNKIEDKKEAIGIINGIKICDPAVGSGHFLVSALNELIAIKKELGLLIDKNGKSLKDYNIEVHNDELIITDEDGRLFEYRPNNKESQRVQETLFHEKQTIIENCLFGVDLNPNSVKICRLRLWIELLKNAYYKNENELETLPNIDINIKQGNSLISRFSLDADLAPALRKSKWNIDSYRIAVDTYRNATTKEEKREMEHLISTIKSDFQSEIDHPFKKKISTARIAVDKLTNEINVQKQWGENINKQLFKDLEKAVVRLKTIEAEKDNIETNKIYENAFEWRFEFPEVLDNDGNFIGFDVVIGNPPYIQLQKMGKDADALQTMGYKTYARTGDIYSLFYEKGHEILKSAGHLIFITSNKWMRAGYGEATRKFLAEKTNPVLLIDFAGQKIFDIATVDTNILLFSKEKNTEKTRACTVKEGALNNLSVFVSRNAVDSKFLSNESWVILSGIEQRIKAKIEKAGTPLKDWDINIYRGVLTGYNEAFIIDGKKREELISADPNSAEIIRPILRGRDIKRYGYEFADLWILFIPWHFPLHNDVNIKGASEIAEKEFKTHYPAIYNHLTKHKQKLCKRNKEETGIRYEWYALQRWGANYWEDFSRQKIVWGEISDRTKFCIDINGKYVTEATTFLLTGDSLFYLLAFLNSRVSEYFFSKIGTTTGVGTVRWKKFTIEQLPVPHISEQNQRIFKDLVLQIIHNKEEDKEYLNLFKEVDSLIYSAIGFDKDEIEFIESQ